MVNRIEKPVYPKLEDDRLYWYTNTHMSPRIFRMGGRYSLLIFNDTLQCTAAPLDNYGRGLVKVHWWENHKYEVLTDYRLILLFLRFEELLN